MTPEQQLHFPEKILLKFPPRQEEISDPSCICFVACGGWMDKPQTLSGLPDDILLEVLSILQLKPV
jgi:hypothetical protein